MWHATTKVVGSGAQKPLHDLTINRCATATAAAAWSQIKPHQNQKHCVRPSQLAPAPPTAAPCHPAADGHWQTHNNFSSAAAFFRKMWSTRLNRRCRRFASVVTRRPGQTALAEWSEKARNMANFAVLALTLNCQHHGQDHAKRGFIQQYVSSLIINIIDSNS